MKLKLPRWSLVCVLITFVLSGHRPPKTPPGTVYLPKAGIYLDKMLLTFEDWNECVFYIKKKHGEDSAAFYAVDSTFVKQVYGEHFFHTSTPLKTYKKALLIGINKQQIQAYCTFRTTVVSMHFPEYTPTPIYSPLTDKKVDVIRQYHPSHFVKIGVAIPEYIISEDGTTDIIVSAQKTKAKHYPKDVYGFRCMAVWKR